MSAFRVTLAVVVCLTGCAGPADAAHDRPTTGSLHGTIVQIGGPLGAEPGHPSGVVTVTRAGRRVAEQKPAEGAEFRFTLTPGVYRLTVKGVDGGCEPADATVTAGSDQAIELTCQRK